MHKYVYVYLYLKTIKKELSWNGTEQEIPYYENIKYLLGVFDSKFLIAHKSLAKNVTYESHNKMSKFNSIERVNGYTSKWYNCYFQ